mgnify:FL=1
MLKKFVIAAALTLAALAPASAHHPGETASKGDIKVSHGWTVATSSMAHAVEVYVTMWNEGETPDKLVGAEVPFADDAVIQAQSVSDDGALEMRDLTSVALEPGQAVTLHPQGVRLVFNDIQRVLRPGDSFDAHLEFAEAGEVAVEITVMAPDQADEMM